MFNLRIILVEPAGALNVGAVARVMKNMGLSQLCLVNPQFDFQSDRFSEAAQNMAVHAQDILEAAQIVPDLPAALVGCQRAIATAGRLEAGEMKSMLPAEGITWLMGSESAAIVFGPEDRGLSNAELQYCQQTMRIPVSDRYPSLNLAQAVGICCYQLRILSQTQTEYPASEANLAVIDMTESYYQNLQAILLKIGYLYPHTTFSRMEKLRHIFNKANLTKAEVTMLRGMLRQIDWAVSRGDRQDIGKE